MEIEQHTKEVISDPESFRSANAGLPIGAILPYYPVEQVQLPTGWLLCAGQKVEDPDSPFDGRKLPDLTDERFLMGTSDNQLFGSYGGVNDIPTDGTHNHGGATSKGGGRKGADNDHDFNAAVTGHHHTIETDGAHNHGGDNRPQFFGVLFLIKIKD